MQIALIGHAQLDKRSMRDVGDSVVKRRGKILVYYLTISKLEAPCTVVLVCFGQGVAIYI
jgi:hypothetical protein